MKIQRYFGISIIAVSLVMFSIGSIPQSFAGTTDFATVDMLMGSSCGISVGVASGSFVSTIDYSGVNPGDVVSGTVGVINTGTSSADIEANTGADGTVGGFALLATPFTTHISSANIGIQIDTFGLASMSPAGTDVPIGPLFGEGVLEVETTAIIISGPVPASTPLGTTVALTAIC